MRNGTVQVHRPSYDRYPVAWLPVPLHIEHKSPSLDILLEMLALKFIAR